MSKSSTVTDLLPDPTPGEILAEEFLAPMGLNESEPSGSLFCSLRSG
jgi:plasmid maintenance system antidote protein VapI